jgi:hypothetical protein
VAAASPGARRRERTTKAAALQKPVGRDDVARQIVEFCRSDSTTGQVLVLDSGVVCNESGRFLMPQHHLGFPGSATLRPSTLMLVVRDVVQSLAVHGFRRFFFVNGHGGNVATVTAAFDELYAGVNGSHATPDEVSLARYCQPQAIKHTSKPTRPSSTTQEIGATLFLP